MSPARIRRRYRSRSGGERIARRPLSTSPPGNAAPPRPRSRASATSPIVASGPRSTARRRAAYPPSARKSSIEVGSTSPTRARSRRLARTPRVPCLRCGVRAPAHEVGARCRDRRPNGLERRPASDTSGAPARCASTAGACSHIPRQGLRRWHRPKPCPRDPRTRPLRSVSPRAVDLAGEVVAHMDDRRRSGTRNIA